jgi:uncharacterized protein YecE (DUF72 family)
MRMDRRSVELHASLLLKNMSAKRPARQRVSARMSVRYLGTAGWAIPRAAADEFPSDGSHLARYAARFNCVEINSSFYRPHRAATYARWAATVPAAFRFAAKMPKEISHVRRLQQSEEKLAQFLGEVQQLGGRLGPLLLQLPPSLAFHRATVAAFFALLRARFDGAVVCEPRHASWFSADCETLLRDHRIARAGADPALVPAARVPGGWPGLRYLRLHGSPVIYRSSYDDAALDAIAAELRSFDGVAWCIFDNTTFGAAASNAASLQTRLLSPIEFSASRNESR